MTTALALGLLGGCSWSDQPPADVFGASPQPSGLFGAEDAGSDASSSLAESLTDNPVSRAIGSGFAKVASWMEPPDTTTVPDPTSLAFDSGEPGPDLHVAMARLEEQAQNYKGAAEQYAQALQLNPNYLPALLGSARLYDRQGNFAQAIELYRQAVERHPESATALNDLGLCHARQGQYQLSAAALQKAVRLAPEEPLYRNNLATVLIELGNTEAAFRHLAAAHGRATAHYNLGYLLYQRDKPQQAAEQFRLALREEPSLDAARQWLAKLQGPAAGKARPVSYPSTGSQAARRLPPENSVR
jgi:tetratricopeptide (TPR) repeat protein